MSDTSFKAGQKKGSGRYTLIKQLGQGGMGMVWLAQDEELNQPIALKFVSPIIQADIDALQGLKRETAKTRILTHPNIVRTFDFHRLEGELPFVSMEYVEGKNLAELRYDQPNEVFAWETLKLWVKQLCDALEYAHNKGIIHRDLKPGNVMVDIEGNVKLADFGIAAMIHTSLNRVSLQHSSSGTPAYMSLQQFKGESPKPADDIYSLGATLYHLITGEVPYNAHPGAIRSVMESDPVMPIEDRLRGLGINNPVPLAVSSTIMACLEREPEKRPGSAKEIWVRLEKGDVLAGSQSLPKNVVPVTISAKPLEQLPATVAASKSEVIPVTIAAAQKLPIADLPATKPATRLELPATVAAKEVTDQVPLAVPVTVEARTTDQLPTSKFRWAIIGIVMALLVLGGWYWGMYLPKQAQQEKDRIAGEAKQRQIEKDRQVAEQKLAQERKTREEAEQQRLADAKVKQEAALLKSQQEAKAQEEVRRKADAEAAALAEEKRKVEEAQKKAIADQNAKEDESARLKEEQRLKSLAEQKAREDEARQKAEEEARLKALAEQKAKEEAEKKKSQPQLGENWTNSLGMAFAPVPGTKVLFGIWETRVQDYAAYANANSGVNVSWKKVEFMGVPISDGPDHPVTMVSWDDAKAFCAWLSKKEQGEGKLASGQEYRLPTDAEWSYAVGIGGREGSGTPFDKEKIIKDVYPWGTQWPPPKGTGNYADMTSKQKIGGSFKFIEGYDDGYATTAPVGSFKGDKNGLFDLSGNVGEWCEDFYYGTKGDRVLRGASWRNFNPANLRVSWRNVNTPDYRNDHNGFRVVVAVDASGEKKRKTEEAQKQKNLAEQQAARIQAEAFYKQWGGKRWKNSLGMSFVPVPGTKVLFCIWETRARDYLAYANANPGVDSSWKNVEYAGDVPVSNGPDHPVTMVSWNDAKAFCQWLTKKEQQEKKMTVNQEYRLPTDVEWSYAVGIGDQEVNGTPKDKMIKGLDVYPWGSQWPPPKGAGNYADMSAKRKFGRGWPIIEGYDDKYATTAPVGSFKADKNGLFDLSGNVWEMCEDFFDGQSGNRMVRGGSWLVNESVFLLSSRRNSCAPDFRCNNYGFRVVAVMGEAGFCKYNCVNVFLFCFLLFW